MSARSCPLCQRIRGVPYLHGWDAKADYAGWQATHGEARPCLILRGPLRSDTSFPLNKRERIAQGSLGLDDSFYVAFCHFLLAALSRRRLVWVRTSEACLCLHKRTLCMKYLIGVRPCCHFILIVCSWVSPDLVVLWWCDAVREAAPSPVASACTGLIGSLKQASSATMQPDSFQFDSLVWKKFFFFLSSFKAHCFYVFVPFRKTLHCALGVIQQCDPSHSPIHRCQT